MKSKEHRNPPGLNVQILRGEFLWREQPPGRGGCQAWLDPSSQDVVDDIALDIREAKITSVETVG